MSGLVEWLRAVDHSSVEDCFLQSPLFGKAADEITRLTARVAELEGALSAAAKIIMDDEYDQSRIVSDIARAIEDVSRGVDTEESREIISDFNASRRAKAALEPKP